MVARFVTVDISAEQAFSCHIFGLGEEFIRQMHGKQGVQLVDKTAVSTHQANQIGRSLRNIERVVPGISLDKTLSVCAEQIDLLFPATVFVTRTGKTETGFEHVSCKYRQSVCLPAKGRCDRPSSLHRHSPT